jgi:hypothetical protein
MGIDITSFYIYRWRYYIGYGLIGLLLIALLVFVGLYVPGGISHDEKVSVIQSASIHFDNISSLAVINLPYQVLQQASLQLFGVHDFSIKLPSLILAFASAVGLILLLRQWFKGNIAVLSAVIALTTGQFIFIAQSGTAGILYLLWSVWLLLIGTFIAKKVGNRFLWKILFFVIAALSLYTPLSVYALFALAMASILHPHLRFIIRSLSKAKMALGIILALIIVSPLVLGVIKSPELGLSLLGIPSQFPDIFANINTLASQYIGFWIPSTTSLMTPVFGFGSAIIICLGIYRLIRTRDSTQSYLIIIWLACLIPILVTNPLYTSVTFLPLVLLMATGLASLLSYWYRLFPRNPYARIAGLIPLIVLISALVLTGLERYTYGYRYDPYTVPNFSKDLASLPKNTKQLVVSEDQLAFYTVVANYNKTFSVALVPSESSFVATHDGNQTFLTYKIDRIITSSSLQDADRFYIYKKSGQ